jgi:hypothetical protein
MGKPTRRATKKLKAKTMAKKANLRLVYMGANPRRGSGVWQAVYDRMKAEGLIDGDCFYCERSEQWILISLADMGHIDAAVLWWNREGYTYGARSKEVRKWMNNPDNYRFEEPSANRSHGALLGRTHKYRSPL